MITNEMAAKFHLPPIDEYPFPERDWYDTFLIQSDRDALQAIEEQLLVGKKGADYTELLAARAEARQAIASIDENNEKDPADGGDTKAEEKSAAEKAVKQEAEEEGKGNA